MAVAFIDVQLTSGAQAFQLFDSWAGTLSRADYERYVLPHSQRVFARAGATAIRGAPGIHFGIGCDHLLEAMHAAGPRIMGLDWRTPITAARARLGADLVVQGNLDPALVLAGAGPALAGARAVLADNAGHPGHVFNLGHGVHPTTDPGVLAAIVDLVHDDDTAMTVGVVLMAYGTPRRAGGDRALLHRHPPRPAADARAARRPDPPLRRDRRHLPARRARPSRQRDVLQAALDERAPGAYVVALGLKHAAPKIEDGVAALAAAGVERVVGLVLAPHFSTMSIGEYLGRAAGGRRARRAAVRRHRELGDRAGVRRLPRPRRRRRPRRAAAGLAGRVHRPLAARADPRRRRPVPRRAARRPPAAVADRLGLERLGDRLAVCRPDARTVDRPRRAGRRRRPPPAPCPACSCARAASSPTTSRCSTTSTSRPAGAPTAAGLPFAADALDERRPGRARRAGRPRRRRSPDDTRS